MGNKSIGRQAHSEKMLGLIAKWRSSGQSRGEFSKSNGISLAVFGYWLRQCPDLESSFSEERGKFIGLNVGNIGCAAGVLLDAKIELEYPNGVQLRVAGMVSSDWLKSLIH